MEKKVNLYRGDKPRIYIIDVTNRDGVQSYKMHLANIEKAVINHLLDEMGIYQSEFGFPAHQEYEYKSPMNTHFERQNISGNLDLQKVGYLPSIILEGWVRAIADDVEKSHKRYKDLKHLNLSVSTSDIMIREKLRKSEKEIIDGMTYAVKRANELGFEKIGVNAEDASRTRHFGDQSYLEEFALAAKEAGADRFRYCDTLGYDTTFSIRERVRRLAEKVKMPIELHCHNDLGSAVANSVEGALGALDADVDAYINTTINTYGERAGNADLVTVLLALKFSSGLSEMDILDPRINLKMAWRICTYTSDVTGRPIPPNQPGVGDNAFSHESGIHADGQLKNPKNYELYGPEDLGIPPKEERELGRRISIGEFSGRHGIEHILNSNNLTVRNIDEAVDLLTRSVYSKQDEVYDLDELKLIAEYPDQVRLML